MSNTNHVGSTNHMNNRENITQGVVRNMLHKSSTKNIEENWKERSCIYKFLSDTRHNERKLRKKVRKLEIVEEIKKISHVINKNKYI